MMPHQLVKHDFPWVSHHAIVYLEMHQQEHTYLGHQAVTVFRKQRSVMSLK